MLEPFRFEMKVRDYECDLQGIVNNAVYQNYLEHARHEYLISKEVSFAELAKQGLNLVVIRAELDYKSSLTSGDEFFVTVVSKMKDRIRFQFEQDIIRSDGKLSVKAVITGTGVNEKGRPMIPADVKQKLWGA